MATVLSSDVAHPHAQATRTDLCVHARHGTVYRVRCFAENGIRAFVTCHFDNWCVLMRESEHLPTCSADKPREFVGFETSKEFDPTTGCRITDCKEFVFQLETAASRGAATSSSGSCSPPSSSSSSDSLSPGTGPSIVVNFYSMLEKKSGKGKGKCQHFYNKTISHLADRTSKRSRESGRMRLWGTLMPLQKLPRLWARRRMKRRMLVLVKKKAFPVFFVQAWAIWCNKLAEE
ncbi:unnamed protein product, partial [Amoebophrya sp. A25]|eukprot:GSA25T00022814001.1